MLICRLVLLHVLFLLCHSTFSASSQSLAHQEEEKEVTRTLRRKRGHDRFYVYGEDVYKTTTASKRRQGSSKRSSKSGKGGKGKGSSKSSKARNSSKRSRNEPTTATPTTSPIKEHMPKSPKELVMTDPPTLSPTASPTELPTSMPSTTPTKLSESPSVAPSINPTESSGSMWPSMQPSRLLQRVRVTDYYMAYVIPGLTMEPTQDDIDQLLENTRRFFVSVFTDFYAESEVQFLDLRLSIKEVLYDAGIPEEKFNLYMNYDTVILYELDSPQPSSALESFSIMADADFQPYLIDYVRAIPDFITVEEVDFRAVRSFEPASVTLKGASTDKGESTKKRNVFCRSSKSRIRLLC